MSNNRIFHEGSFMKFNITGRIICLVYETSNIFNNDIAVDKAKVLTCSY